MSEGDAAALLERLLHHLVRLVNLGENPRTVKTLYTALIEYFLRPSATWHQCMRHVMVCFAQNRALSIETFRQSEYPSDALVANLSGPQIFAALWFAAGLAEEARQAVVINTETYAKQHD